MDIKQRLSEEVITACKPTGFDSQKAYQELMELIGSDEVIDYYISQGPFPNFPDALFDVFVLTESYLYDYEMKKSGSLYHVLPVSKISGISESFAGAENDSISVAFRYGALGGGLVLEDKLDNKERLRKFCGKVKGKLT